MNGAGWAAVGGGWGALVVVIIVAYTRVNTRLAVLEERTRDKHQP